MMDIASMSVVDLQQRRDELADQLYDVEIYLHAGLIDVARQLTEGKSVPPAVALILARNGLPDIDCMD